MSEQSYDFCYWDARSDLDTIIIACVQVLTTCIFAVLILRLARLIKSYRSGNPIRLSTLLGIHLLVSVWAIAHSVVNLYSIIVYLKLQEKMSNQAMRDHSYIFSLLNSVPGFLVPTLIITIGYTFLKNLLKNGDVRLFPKFSFRLLRVMRVYVWLRLVAWLCIILAMVISTGNPNDLKDSYGGQVVYLIIDSVIINIFLMMLLWYFIRKLKEDKYRMLRVQYGVLMICSLIRVIVDTCYLMLLIVGDGLSNDHQYCVKKSQSTMVYTIGYNAIGTLLMHLLPIVVILKIYTYDGNRRSSYQEEQSDQSTRTHSDALI